MFCSEVIIDHYNIFNDRSKGKNDFDSDEVLDVREEVVDIIV